MIPWFRERLAESRARWQTRKQRNEPINTTASPKGTESLVSSDGWSNQGDVELNSVTADSEHVLRCVSKSTNRIAEQNLIISHYFHACGLCNYTIACFLFCFSF